MEKTSNRFTVRRLAVTGLLSALVFVFSWIQIPIGGGSAHSSGQCVLRAVRPAVRAP